MWETLSATTPITLGVWFKHQPRMTRGFLTLAPRKTLQIPQIPQIPRSLRAQTSHPLRDLWRMPKIATRGLTVMWIMELNPMKSMVTNGEWM